MRIVICKRLFYYTHRRHDEIVHFFPGFVDGNAKNKAFTCPQTARIPAEERLDQPENFYRESLAFNSLVTIPQCTVSSGSTMISSPSYRATYQAPVVSAQTYLQSGGGRNSRYLSLLAGIDDQLGADCADF